MRPGEVCPALPLSALPQPQPGTPLHWPHGIFNPISSPSFLLRPPCPAVSLISHSLPGPSPSPLSLIFSQGPVPPNTLAGHSGVPLSFFSPLQAQGLEHSSLVLGMSQLEE